MSSAVLVRLRPSSQLLANGIVGVTLLLVRTAMQGNWTSASAIACNRRALLGRLEQDRHAGEESCVNALRQAVVESDNALAAICPAAGRRHLPIDAAVAAPQLPQGITHV